jgi:predicted acetyltransferase
VAAEIEIGVLEADEMEPLLNLMCEAFEMDLDAARPIFYSDPYLDVRNRYVLRVNRSIASCLTVVERECWIGEAIVRVAGIAGVATLPDYRRRGLAGRLLTETVQLLAGRGFHIAALFPSSRNYYQNYGWETGGSQHAAHVERATLRSDTEGTVTEGNVQVRRAIPDDIAALARIYDNGTFSRTMHCLRDEKRWRYLLTYVPNSFVAVAEDGNVRGYTIYELRPDPAGSHALPAATAGRSTLRLLEINCETLDAMRALQSHLAEQHTANHIEFAAPSDVIVQNGFTMPATETASFMARIIDWEGLLRALSTNWHTLDGAVGLALTDPILSPVPRCAVVYCTGAQMVVELVDAAALNARCRDFVVGDVRAWSSVVVGYRSAREAIDTGLLKASTASAAAVADRLFPAREPFLPTADHF